ncbi:hypothetical protein D3C80_1380450 [compost metagenome]
MQNNAIRHGSAYILLAQGCQEGLPRHVRLNITHAHIILQIIPGLWICRQAVRLAVVVHLPGQPVVNQIIKIRIRSRYLDTASALPDVFRILLLSEHKSVFTGCVGSQEQPLTDSSNLLLIMSGSKHETVFPFFTRSKADAVLKNGYGRFITCFSVGQQSAFECRW